MFLRNGLIAIASDGGLTSKEVNERRTNPRAAYFAVKK
jgi:hypothetical protein